MFYIFDLIFLLFIFLSFRGVHKVDDNEDYLSLSTSKSVRGFLSILIIFHHISQRVNNGYLFRICYLVGYPCVAIFFFQSGYGLIQSVMKKKDYHVHFLKKRALPILIIYTLMTLVYMVCWRMVGTVYHIEDIFRTILFTDRPIDEFSWYILNILFYYVWFNLYLQKTPDDPKEMIKGTFIGTFVWSLACLLLTKGSWWYQTSLLFPLGMVYAYHEDKYRNYIITNYKKVLRNTILAYIACNLIKLYFTWHFNILYYFICTIGIAITMVGFVLLYLIKHQFGNPALNFLGQMSLELYLTQGLLLNVFRYVIPLNLNPLFYTLFSLVMTIILAYGLHQLAQRLNILLKS